MKQITVRLNNELYVALDQAAERVGRTRAAVARVAIDNFLGSSGAAGGDRSADASKTGRPNPYARTRPTPREERERNLVLRQIREARLKERRLLARLDGITRECEHRSPAPDEVVPVDFLEEDDSLRNAEPDDESPGAFGPEGSGPEGSGPEPVGAEPVQGERIEGEPSGQALSWTQRRILEAFGPVEEPESLEEFRAWLRAPFPETPEYEDDQEW